jgi:hypothetical protein
MATYVQSVSDRGLLRQAGPLVPSVLWVLHF